MRIQAPRRPAPRDIPGSLVGEPQIQRADSHSGALCVGVFTFDRTLRRCLGPGERAGLRARRHAVRRDGLPAPGSRLPAPDSRLQAPRGSQKHEKPRRHEAREALGVTPETPMEASSPETRRHLPRSCAGHPDRSASSVFMGSPGTDFLSCLSAGLPSTCSACDCWLSPLSISTFTVAGRPSWLAQDTRSAVVIFTRPRSTPHELHVTLDAPLPSRSRRTGPLFPPSRVGPRSPRPESPLLKIRSRIGTLLPYSRSWPSRDSRSRVITTEWPPPRAATRLPPAWFLTTSAVRAPAPLGDCCTPAGQDSHRFGLEQPASRQTFRSDPPELPSPETPLCS